MSEGSKNRACPWNRISSDVCVFVRSICLLVVDAKMALELFECVTVQEFEIPLGLPRIVLERGHRVHLRKQFVKEPMLLLGKLWLVRFAIFSLTFSSLIFLLAIL